MDMKTTLLLVALLVTAAFAQPGVTDDPVVKSLQQLRGKHSVDELQLMTVDELAAEAAQACRERSILRYRTEIPAEYLPLVNDEARKHNGEIIDSAQGERARLPRTCRASTTVSRNFMKPLFLADFSGFRPSHGAPCKAAIHAALVVL
jgi:hypothetical protein